MNLLVEIVPFIGSCAAAQLVLMLSESSSNKTMFQTTFFGLICVMAILTITQAEVCEKMQIKIVGYKYRSVFDSIDSCLHDF